MHHLLLSLIPSGWGGRRKEIVPHKHRALDGGRALVLILPVTFSLRLPLWCSCYCLCSQHHPAASLHSQHSWFLSGLAASSVNSVWFAVPAPPGAREVTASSLTSSAASGPSLSSVTGMWPSTEGPKVSPGTEAWPLQWLLPEEYIVNSTKWLLL